MDTRWLETVAKEAIEERAAAQELWELYAAGLIVGSDPPRRVLEIGTASAGALWFWSQIATSDAKIASIDVSHHDVHPENLGDMPEHQELYMHLGDSRDANSVGRVLTFFKHELIDFLFIDGDHSYIVSKKDWINYSQFVRPGGWVGFHDVEGSYVADGGSHRTWLEVKEQHPVDHVEIQLRKEGGMGIGLVRM